MVKCVEFHPSARVAVVAATNGTAGLFQVCFKWMYSKFLSFIKLINYEFVLWFIFFFIYYLIYLNSRYFLRWYKNLFSNILQFCVIMFFINFDLKKVDYCFNKYFSQNLNSWFFFFFCLTSFSIFIYLHCQSFSFH